MTWITTIMYDFLPVLIFRMFFLYPVLANGIRRGTPTRGFNKERSSKFAEGSRVRQTPEEGRRTFPCGNNNKDEDNSPKTLYDKNHQPSSQKLRQLGVICSPYRERKRHFLWLEKSNKQNSISDWIFLSNAKKDIVMLIYQRTYGLSQQWISIVTALRYKSIF